MKVRKLNSLARSGAYNSLLIRTEADCNKDYKRYGVHMRCLDPDLAVAYFIRDTPYFLVFEE